jgi:hypothetical protein
VFTRRRLANKSMGAGEERRAADQVLGQEMEAHCIRFFSQRPR